MSPIASTMDDFAGTVVGPDEAGDDDDAALLVPNVATIQVGALAIDDSPGRERARAITDLLGGEIDETYWVDAALQDGGARDRNPPDATFVCHGAIVMADQCMLGMDTSNRTTPIIFRDMADALPMAGRFAPRKDVAPSGTIFSTAITEADRMDTEILDRFGPISYSAENRF